MSTSFVPVQSTPGIFSNSSQKPLKMSDILIDRINNIYTREDAKKNGIYYWPEPLPTPDNHRRPDPLVLFRPEKERQDAPQIELVPLTLQEVIARRSREVARLSMQIPLGLIDLPEQQRQETLLVDLHGNAGILAGGPLMVVGKQNSGKGTALQTMLLWLTSRYLPTQLRCIAIDPGHDLELFRALPHFFDADGYNFWSDGATDEEIKQITNRVTKLITQRRELAPGQRWNDDTLAQLWNQGTELPLILLIISHYQRFVDRLQTMQDLKKLFFLVAESRALGAYAVITSSEVSLRHISADVLSKIGTRLSLFLNESQRAEFFGRIHLMDPIPGRGLLLTQERQVNQIQLALPTSGSTETERYEQLKLALRYMQA